MFKPLVPVVLLTLAILSCDVEQPPLVNALDMFDRGVILFDEGEYQQAEVLFTQALTLYEQEKELSRLAECYGYVSRISLVQGQFKNALETAQTAFEYDKQANDFRGQARIDLLLGDVYRSMGEYEHALEHYEASHALSSAFDDRASKATSALKKGYVLFLMNRWDEALAENQQALEFYQSAGESDGEAQALVALGEVYHRQRRYGEALNSLTQAQESLDLSENPLLGARMKAAFGNVYRAVNDGNSALLHFRDGVNRLRSLRAGREYETLLLFGIATMYDEGGRLEDAKRFYNEAAAVARTSGDRLAENYLYLFIANATERQIPAVQPAFQIDKRIDTYTQIAQRFQECAHPIGEAYAYARAGDLYRSVGRLAEARSMYERAIALNDTRYGEYIDPAMHLPYQIELGMDRERERWHKKLAGVLMKIRRPADALQVVDRARSETFAGLLRDEDITIRNVGLQKDMQDYRSKFRECRLLQLELSSLLADRDFQASPRQVQILRTRFAKLNGELQQTATRVARAYPNYEPLTGSSSIGLTEIQNSIPRGTLVLTYLADDQELFIFGITRTGFEVKTVPVGRERLLGLVSEYKNLLHDPNVYAGAAGEASLPAMTRFANLSTQLYDILLRPVDALMDRNLVIVAGKDFEMFPFHALERQSRDGTIQYLIEVTSVDYLGTLSSIRFRTTPVVQTRDVLAVGNPTGKNWSIDYELRDIRSFFKDANVLIGFEATWRNMVSDRADILQLATDFRNNPGNYPFGMMSLSDGETLEESVDIPFVQLTSVPAFPVLMLSNTSGQGVGLTPLHAFLLRINGTSDVFFNAWGAERKAAKFFSEFFYTHLSNGLAPGDAYRQALLNLIRTPEVNHPFSWGQFFHYGVG
ncbi:MAG TPA: tetratricopeptide repeat protein [Bacteroidota bacterium]